MSTSTRPLSENMIEILADLDKARSAHNANVAALEDIKTAITRCHQQQHDAEVSSQESESNWRKLFRSLRGEMTDELKAGHNTRIAQRELTKEFAGLLEDMEWDQKQVMLRCCGTAKTYKEAHIRAAYAYARHEVYNSLSTIQLPHLVRAMKLSVALRHPYSHSDSDVYQEIMEMVGKLMHAICKITPMDMTKEPIAMQIGLEHPDVMKGLDRELYNSPVRRTRLAEALLKRKKEQENKQGKKNNEETRP
ncbi:aldehyde dehydrogenase [Acerihabitans sp. TG2]|uniref:aldehyde dehydrogenase n=1 Tax=Acerihabitans sp. TG2 TaxID=3096008 RepID=UPI002B23E606|nr:aldehyde dehydrogenase [Acerihabitans sp. TG2]MEA9393506.1 aldehyde dehydrogenase [Acerihabitans sp. TG2]